MTVKEWGGWAGLVLAVGIASWVLLAAMLQESAALSQWWQAQWSFDGPSLTHGPKTWAWTWWPAWPVIAALLVQAWRHRLLGLAHLQLLLVLLGASLVMGLLGVGNVNPTRTLPVVALTSLAAFGLLSLPRGLSSLIDLFAVTLFSGLGILVWLYWSAIEFNQPAFFAERLAFHAPWHHTPGKPSKPSTWNRCKRALDNTGPLADATGLNKAMATSLAYSRRAWPKLGVINGVTAARP